MNRFEWVAPSTLDEALDHLARGGVAKAGGVDLLDRMKEGLDRPARVVSLAAIPGLDRIESDRDGLRLGPLATLARIGDSAEVRSRWRALAQAADKAATPQIRNMATVGGNLLQRPRCWYFRSEAFDCLRKGGDHCPAIAGENQYHAIFDNDLCAIVHPSAAAVPLIAYGAVLEIAGSRGSRQTPLESFFVHPRDQVTREHSLAADELIVAIRVPAPASGSRAAYLKQGEKESFDWPIADAAAVLEMDGPALRRASIILGAAAPVPRRARAAEAYLRGKLLSEATAAEAARLALDGATPLSKNGYKVPLYRTVVARTLLVAARQP
ncbi:MAG TPA: FAD binding domain-containing protein [Thermoanaerobaculia bacterium]|nr:FAD binding domain-containing protein [Thermoanaerobaculia bacterium]